MDKKIRLREKSEEFQKLLKKYSTNDADVAQFLLYIQPWFEKIEQDQISPPCYDYKLSSYFTNPDLSPLVERYFDSGHELGRASSEFTAAIRDW